MKCSYCGHELSDGSLFCENCGKEVPLFVAEPEKVFCSNCGAEMDKGTKFCGNCGSLIDKPIETPVKDTIASPVDDITANPADNTPASPVEDTPAKPEGKVEITKKNKIMCTYCGARIPADSQTCRNCGRPVRQAQPTPPAQPARQTPPIPPVQPVRQTPQMPPTPPVYPEYNIPQTVTAKKNGKKNTTLIIVLSAVIAALIAGIAACIIFDPFHFFGKAEDKINEGPDAAATPQVTAEPTPKPTHKPKSTPKPTVNPTKLQTYYVVNCKDSISLRELPIANAKVIKEIPLGSPVSYVEPAQNGFAKIIYNGTTGYALQSYLSSNSADIKKPETNSGSNNTNSGNQSTSSGAVKNPSYTTYRDSTYNFSCTYPGHFQVYNDSDSFVRYSLKAPDNTATLKICATNNKANLSVQTVLNNFKTSYPGTVDYQNSGDTWCAISTLENGQCHYGYFKVANGMIRGFELHYDRKYESIYDGYVNDIYKSLNFN